MQAIFQGRRHFVVGRTADGIWIERLAGEQPPTRHLIAEHDPDLILDPTDEDLDLAEAFELGEISAFEYPDGHTFPPDREIQRPRKRSRVYRFPVH